MEENNVQQLKEDYFREIIDLNGKAVNKYDNDPKIYHSRCRYAIKHFIKDERIPEDKDKETIRRMSNMGVGIGCSECKDIGRYVNSILEGDEATKGEIEDKYHRRSLLVLKAASEREDPESVLNMPGTAGMLRMSDLDPKNYGNLFVVQGYFNGRNDETVLFEAIDKDRLIPLDRQIRRKFYRLADFYPIDDGEINIGKTFVFDRDTSKIIENREEINKILV